MQYNWGEFEYNENTGIATGTFSDKDEAEMVYGYLYDNLPEYISWEEPSWQYFTSGVIVRFTVTIDEPFESDYHSNWRFIDAQERGYTCEI